MKLNITIVRVFLLLSVLCAVLPAYSQTTNPQNLTAIRVDDLTDQQITDLMQKLEATGLPDDKLEQAASAQGMSSTEFKKLRARSDEIKKRTNSVNPDNNPQASNPQSGRQLVSPQDTAIAKKLQDASDAFEDLKPKIFGANLFKRSNTSFASNLQIATPVNYQIGPGDQIKINVYGNSSVNWTLPVTTEGNINIPNAGVLGLQGRTIEQATNLIKARLAANNYAIGHGTNVEVTLGNIRTITVILTGEVSRPGSYNLPSLATVYNALYEAGGPSENGSFREIRVIRNKSVVATIDVYDYLINGFDVNDIRLHDQDRIVIPVYKTRVEFAGEVKRPQIFETKSNETLKNVIDFAGGFTSRANTSRVRVFQNTSRERRQVDVNEGNYDTYIPKSGDKYFVGSILERFENRVVIEGAVFNPDQYELTSGMTLKQLIQKAGGPREDAFSPRGSILRLKADNTIEQLSFDVSGIISGAAQDIVLQREDIVKISSIFDTREEYKVSIDGEVREPGTFDFAEGMTLEDLILKAGAFKEGGSPKRIEVARRVKNSDVNSASAIIANVFTIDVDKDLKFSQNKFILQPFDIVVVRAATGYEIQRQIKVEGEVASPGIYTLQRKDERISEIIKRAGGLTALAYPQGALLKRPGASVKSGTNNGIDRSAEEQDRLLRLQRLQGTAKDTLNLSQQKEVVNNVNVGINLDKILLKPGSRFDLVMEEGDTLRVPKQLQIVKVSGEVSSPTQIIYIPGKGFKQYISEAGGFSDRSLKRRAYVLYANGSVKGTNKILFFNDYPRIRPGAEIFVPKKAEKAKLSATEIVGISTGLASLAAIILSVLK